MMPRTLRTSNATAIYILRKKAIEQRKRRKTMGMNIDKERGMMIEQNKPK